MFTKETVAALEKQNIPIVSDLPDEPFTFGSFTLQFFNTVTDLSKPHAGENVSSVGVKVTKGKRTAFLAADISAEGGLENRMAPLVGKVDLLKVGHHATQRQPILFHPHAPSRNCNCYKPAG